MKKINNWSAGLVQALGVVLYVSIVASIMWGFNGWLSNSPNVLTMILILTLLVLSAAITGAIVFVYPAYLFLNKKTRAALAVFGYTLLFILVVFIALVAVLATFG